MSGAGETGASRYRSSSGPGRKTNSSAAGRPASGGRPASVGSAGGTFRGNTRGCAQRAAGSAGVSIYRTRRRPLAITRASAPGFTDPQSLYLKLSTGRVQKQLIKFSRRPGSVEGVESSYERKRRKRLGLRQLRNVQPIGAKDAGAQRLRRPCDWST